MAVWPGGGFASPALPQLRRWDFLPLDFAHSSRGKKVRLGSPPLRFGQSCGVRRTRPSDAIEAAWGGLENRRTNTMANIGSFKKVGGEYQGSIVTLSVQAKGVRIVPEDNRPNDKAPTHRVYVGRAEIGAAWAKTSAEQRDYLSVKLDDPSFTQPIFANLFDDEGGETYSLIWSRPQRSSND
jgi:uncharacterized protein (DUF736 family)